MTPGDIIELDLGHRVSVEVIAPSNYIPKRISKPSNSSFTVYTDHAGLASIYNIQGQLVECIKINSEQQVQVGENFKQGIT